MGFDASMLSRLQAVQNYGVLTGRGGTSCRETDWELAVLSLLVLNTIFRYSISSSFSNRIRLITHLVERPPQTTNHGVQLTPTRLVHEGLVSLHKGHTVSTAYNRRVGSLCPSQATKGPQTQRPSVQVSYISSLRYRAVTPKT